LIAFVISGPLSVTQKNVKESEISTPRTEGTHRRALQGKNLQHHQTPQKREKPNETTLTMSNVIMAYIMEEKPSDPA
jgi:hypothetical protein